jgi:transcriptional regulator with XRE-family HTH domain
MKVSRQTVYRWEQGERMPDILTLLKLARILGVRVDALLGLPGEPGRGQE